MEQFFAEHWKIVVIGFFILEKLVKLTPTKYDDILVDVIYAGIRKLVGKRTKDGPV